MTEEDGKLVVQKMCNKKSAYEDGRVLSMKLNLSEISLRALKSNIQEGKFELEDMFIPDKPNPEYLAKVNCLLPLTIDKDLD